MGIRFTCPNGHKLNVKEHLAGKRGICPYCKAKVVIPTASTRESSRGQEKDTDDDASETNAEAVEVEASPAAESQPTAPQPAEPTPQPAAAAAKPPAPAPPAAPSAGPDPLDEAPDAVWYVRPPGGGEFGPATPEVMRSWLKEGRVSGDSLVWRDGWDDWRVAAEVFPSLDTPSNSPTEQKVAEPPTREEVASGDRVDVAASDSLSHGKVYRRQSSKASKNNAVAIVIVLALAVLFLGVALIYVLSTQFTGEPAQPADASGDAYWSAPLDVGEHGAA